jgi:hypothetical protein
MKYLERLSALNSEKDSVWNSIDKPMRRLIFEMNRIGLITKFCCFGLPYGEDDEPKTHAIDDCYIHFYFTELGLQNFKTIMYAYGKSFDQLFKFFKFGDVYNLKLLDTMTDHYEHGIDSIHKYEQYSLTISVLTYNLQTLPGKDIVTIVDGNSLYSNVEFWQIDPKPNFVMSVEDFYKQYGKLEAPIAPFIKFKNDMNIIEVEPDEFTKF